MAGQSGAEATAVEVTRGSGIIWRSGEQSRNSLVEEKQLRKIQETCHVSMSVRW